MSVHSPPEFVRALVHKAVRRYIDEAVRSGAVISASDCAKEILRTYPACQLDQDALADQVMMAAARRSAPVRIGRRGYPPSDLRHAPPTVGGR
jgi:hypothetical protein